MPRKKDFQNETCSNWRCRAAAAPAEGGAGGTGLGGGLAGFTVGSVDMDRSLARTGRCKVIRRESCHLCMEMCRLRLALGSHSGRAKRKRRSILSLYPPPALPMITAAAPLSCFPRNHMLARKYLFPHVIELN